ncbi:MAG: hypothetical protein ACE15D_10055 [Candidatus Eisenbacteria bacterium]|nr:hypothetical protein [Candidatus Eisenbacteria bacterium]
MSHRPLRVPVPAASRGTHLLAAAVLWTVVGAGLSAAGIAWMIGSRSPLAVPQLAGALAAGLLKARFVLKRAGAKTVTRIERRGDGRCLGGFLSWRSWLLVLSMIALGRLLRASPLPSLWRGAIYLAIGVALSAASLPIWSAWRHRSRLAR